MGMELKFNKCSYEETLEYYRNNKDFQRYVELYASNRNETERECLEHDIVQTVAYIYKNHGGR